MTRLWNFSALLGALGMKVHIDGNMHPKWYEQTSWQTFMLTPGGGGRGLGTREGNERAAYSGGAQSSLRILQA